MVDIKEAERLLEAAQKIEQETKEEATARISEELREEKKIEERRKVVKNYFKTLTGENMTEAQFILYNNTFNSRDTPDGYNIKSFIRDIGVKLKDVNDQDENAEQELS